MPPTDASPRPRLSPWLRWGLPAVVLVGVLSYANAFRGEFVFDDVKLVVNNAVIKSAARIPDILFSNLWGFLGGVSNYYRPLPPLIFMALHGLFGLRPEPFHAVNILLHAGTSGLVFLLARRLLRRTGGATAGNAEWAALAAALLFAVHPLHTEAVAWISGLMDVACAFFSLLALWAYVRADDVRHATVSRAVAAAALFLALLSKEPAAAVPVLFVLHDVLFRRDRVADVRSMAWRWGPGVAVFLVYLVLRVIALRGVAPVRLGTGVAGATALVNVPALLYRYVEKLFVPVGLNVVHDLTPVASVASPMAIAGLIVFAIVLAVGVWGARREPAALLALATFLLPLLPALYFPALSQELSKAFAERYAYLPSAGLVLLAAVALARLSARRPAVCGAAVASVAIVAVLFAGLTLARNRVWQNSYSLWTDCVQKSPDFVDGHFNLAVALDKRAWTGRAMNEYRAVLARDATHPDAHNNLGVLLAEQNRLDDAISHFEAALRSRPSDAEVRINLAHAYRIREGR